MVEIQTSNIGAVYWILSLRTILHATQYVTYWELAQFYWEHQCGLSHINGIVTVNLNPSRYDTQC